MDKFKELMNKLKELMSQKKTQKIVIVSLISVIVLVVIFIFASLFGGESPVPSEITSVEAPPSSEVASVAEVEDAVVPVREDIVFGDLLETNVDTLAYVSVPNTTIDYPVVRGIDNVKYLTTDFNGEYDVKGTVFMDMFNGNNVVSPVTVLYGHYTMDDTFFAQLHNYRDEEFFDENPDVFLYTPDMNYKYEIVAAFVNDNYSLMYEKDYSQAEQMQGLFDHIETMAAADDTANLNMDDVSVDDNLLVLSTCMEVGGSGDNRYVVVAKLVDYTSSGQP